MWSHCWNSKPPILRAEPSPASPTSGTSGPVRPTPDPTSIFQYTQRISTRPSLRPCASVSTFDLHHWQCLVLQYNSLRASCRCTHDHFNSFSWYPLLIFLGQEICSFYGNSSAPLCNSGPLRLTLGPSGSFTRAHAHSGTLHVPPSALMRTPHSLKFNLHLLWAHISPSAFTLSLFINSGWPPDFNTSCSGAHHRSLSALP